ncbi:MAG: ATP-binding protein [Parvibaculaceae bacterium]
MRISPTLFRTSTFRLAMVYLFVFAVSVGAILGYVYWRTAVLLEDQTDETVRAEIVALDEQYQRAGMQGVLETVANRSRQDTNQIYLFTNPLGRRLAGNLDALPVAATTADGWIEFSYAVDTGGRLEQHTARAYSTELEGGYRIVVGRNVEERRKFAEIIRTTLVWALAITLLLGVTGGLLMSRNFLRRVDSITAASGRIMSGNLSERMPVRGTGDEIDRLSVSLNEMLEQIERLMAGMSEISSNVAHDLRTPLTRLKARAEDALRHGTSGEYKTALEQTLNESDRLLETFNALLSIARVESGEAREGLARVDAAALVREVAELYEPTVEEAGGALKVEAAGEEPVHADRQLLAQALSNLIDNALKHGGHENAPARIDIAVGHAQGEVVVTVADNGPGIPEADRERVKERFVRLETSRSRSGSGLGLSLVAGIMKLHRGRLELEGNNPGLKAKLILPRLVEKA